MSSSQGQWVATEAWEASFQYTRRNLATRLRRIKLFQIPVEALILDFGCGDGLDMQAFKKLGYDRVVGLDNSFNLLRRLSGFKTVQADVYRLPIPTASFDVVFVDSVFHHLDLEAALNSIHCILKPGGRLCFIEPRNSLGRKLLDWFTFSPLARFWPMLAHRRVMLIDELEEHYGWLNCESSLSDTLRQQGFSQIEFQNDWINMFVSCQKLFDSRADIKK
jgi:SAM-dependent methyltransferase